MKFYKHLYISKTIKNPNLVKWKLRIKNDLLGIFVISIATGSDQLEIYDAAFLNQKLHRKLWPPYIIGLTTTQEEAMNMVGQIAAECYEATGTAKIKDYLLGLDK